MALSWDTLVCNTLACALGYRQSSMRLRDNKKRRRSIEGSKVVEDEVSNGLVVVNMVLNDLDLKPHVEAFECKLSLRSEHYWVSWFEPAKGK